MSEPGFSDEMVFQRLGERWKSPNVYRSPFEVFTQNNTQEFDKQRETMQYDGSMQTVLDELSQALQDPTQPENAKLFALHPPRLIRGVLDWKIEHPRLVLPEDIKQVLAAGLAIYKGDPDATNALSGLNDHLAKFNAEGSSLLNTEIHQKKDLPTWMGTNPTRTYKTAMDLAFNYPEHGILIIALAHGATAASMDLFLRYKDVTEREDAVLYPVRYSRNKLKDEKPRLSKEEAEYLTEAGKDKYVFIFEEDSPTHRTLNAAVDFFKTNLFPSQQVLGLSNLPGHTSPNEIVTKTYMLIEK